jgi:hypothetical protein
MAIDARLHAPKPTENVRGENSDPGAGCHTSQIFFGARLSMGEHVTANHDGDQAGNLRYSSGKQGLKRGESALKG